MGNEQLPAYNYGHTLRDPVSGAKRPFSEMKRRVSDYSVLLNSQCQGRMRACHAKCLFPSQRRGAGLLRSWPAEQSSRDHPLRLGVGVCQGGRATSLIEKERSPPACLARLNFNGVIGHLLSIALM